jgi:WD40 repeat protein
MSVAFAPDGRRLATGSMDGTVRVWSVESRKEQMVLRIPGEHWVHSVAFSPDGEILATAWQALVGAKPGRIRLFRCDGWSTAAAADGPGKKVLGLAFSPDGKTLASCGEGGPIVLWVVNGLHKERTLEVPRDTTSQAIAFSPDGKRLASAMAEGEIGIWNLEEKEHASTNPAAGK